MENKEKKSQPWEEPSLKSFKRAIYISLIVMFFYAGFQIWRNYYAKGVPPMINKQEGISPYYRYNK